MTSERFRDLKEDLGHTIGTAWDYIMRGTVAITESGWELQRTRARGKFGLNRYYIVEPNSREFHATWFVRARSDREAINLANVWLERRTKKAA